MINDRLIELYKHTHIGTALQETLSHFTNTGELSEDQKNEFIQVFSDTFKEVISEVPQPSCNIQGHLDSYNHIDNQWTFYIKEAKITNTNGEKTEQSMVKLLALDNHCEEAEKKAGRRKRRKLKED